MILEQIDWSRRSQVEELRRRYGSETSAHTFSSLYIWKVEMQLSLVCSSDFFAVHFGTRGENSWFFPCGDRDALYRFFQERLRTTEAPCRFYYASREDTALLDKWFPGRFSFCRTAEDDEYIYDRVEQLALKGKHFRHQRNELHKARERLNLHIVDISSDNVEQCIQVLSSWKTLHKTHKASEPIDAVAGDTLLRNMERLGLSGILVLMGGLPVAVAAGYPISESMFDLCVCQQITSYKEISTFARHALFQRLGEEMREINAEEDLGIEGLRTLKQGMNPSRVIEMYECIDNKGENRT